MLAVGKPLYTYIWKTQNLQHPYSPTLSTITPHDPIEAKDYIGNATGQINNVHLESGCAKINGYTNKCLISSLVMLLRGLIVFSCAGDVRLMITEKRVMYR